jgi:hypothetical protein
VNLCAAPYNFLPEFRVLDDWMLPFDRLQLALRRGRGCPKIKNLREGIPGGFGGLTT